MMFERWREMVFGVLSIFLRDSYNVHIQLDSADLNFRFF